jgi:hypothetical protein
MSSSTYANSFPQWTYAGTYGLPAAFPYHYSHNAGTYYQNYSYEMGKKGKKSKGATGQGTEAAYQNQASSQTSPRNIDAAAAKNVPGYGDASQVPLSHQRAPYASENRYQPSASITRHSGYHASEDRYQPPAGTARHSGYHASEDRYQPPAGTARQSETQSRVSSAAIYSLVDAWRSYKADHIDVQMPVDAMAQANAYSATGYHPQYQPQPRPDLPWRSNPATSQQSGYNPQASTFQPGQRLVNGFAPHSSYRINKCSRYNLHSSPRSTQIARSYATVSPDQVVRSIENDSEPLLLPLRFTGKRISNQRQSTPRRGPTPINPDIQGPATPVADAQYIEQAQRAPAKLSQPRKLLVLLDLNGTLVYRHGPNRQLMVKRPGVDRFLEYLFSNHAPMIFTSATSRSAQKMAKELLTPQQYGDLVAIRTREHLGLNQEQYRNKVQVYKDLRGVWSHDQVKWSGQHMGVVWDASNTVLIDDSIIKAKSHPHSLIQVSEFVEPGEGQGKKNKQGRRDWEAQERAVLESVEAKLEELRWQVNVTHLIRQWQEGEQVAPGTIDEQKDQLTLKSVKEQVESIAKASAEAGAVDYPTPTSLARPSVEKTEEGKDEYDPEDFQGVKLPTTEAQGKAESKSEAVENSKVCSPSPVTEQDFAFVMGGNGKYGA